MAMSPGESDRVPTQELAARIQGAVEAGARAFHDDRRPVASGHLFDAIRLAQSAPSGALRRNELVELGRLCLQAQFEDLGLVALVEAISECEAAGDHLSAGKLMMDVANTFARLLNHDEASHWNERALRTSLDHGHHANAASASTNLAAYALWTQDLARAHELASASLGYLEREAFPRTETVARALLTQIGDQLDRPAEEVIAIARPLFGRLRATSVSDELRRETVEALDNVARRYLEAHPQLDASAWRRTQLPELWGGGA